MPRLASSPSSSSCFCLPDCRRVQDIANPGHKHGLEGNRSKLLAYVFKIADTLFVFCFGDSVPVGVEGEGPSHELNSIWRQINAPRQSLCNAEAILLENVTALLAPGMRTLLEDCGPIHSRPASPPPSSIVAPRYVPPLPIASPSLPEPPHICLVMAACAQMPGTVEELRRGGDAVGDRVG